MTKMIGLILILGLVSILITLFVSAANPANKPVISDVVITSTSGYNRTYDNYTVTYTSTDADGDAVWNTTWFNSSSKPVGVVFDFNTNQSTNIKDVAQGNDGSAISSSWTPSGSYGGGFLMDGVAEQITIGTNEDYDPRLFLNDTGGTVCLRVSASTPSGSPTLYSRSTSGAGAGDYMGSGGWIWRISSITTNTSFIRFGYANSSTSANGYFKFNNAWNYYCITFNSITKRLYRNGALFGTYTVAGLPGNIVNISRIGAYNTTTGYINGIVDDFRIYPYVLSTASISLLNRNESFTLPRDELTIGDDFWTANLISTDTLNYSSVSQVSFAIDYSCDNNATNTDWLLDVDENCVISTDTSLGTGNLSAMKGLWNSSFYVKANLTIGAQYSGCDGCKMIVDNGQVAMVG